ncbi:Tia1 protein [Dirofilaria immitis]|nr:Tia1 protein [Dirofilaria immitis]
MVLVVVAVGASKKGYVSIEKKQGTNDPYAFVEFADHYTAAQALQAMNKRVLLEKEMKVNWATEPGSQAKVDTSKHFHVFVGDLSPEVDNKALKDAFAPFGEVSDAKVIRDATTLKSKGYGFVSYPKREEAERAIEQMNGQWLGRRTIRTNWATRKPTGTGAGDGQYGRTELNYDDVYNQTGPDNTSVYVGNVNSSANDEDLRAAFDKFGRILEVRIFKSQGYAFVRFDKKDSACNAICKMNGQELCGQNIKCSWGRTPEGHNQQATAYNQAQAYANYGGYGAYGYGNGASGGPGGSAAAQQQYWNYYQQYYSNPQLVQQQWQSYWQQQQPQGGNQTTVFLHPTGLCLEDFMWNTEEGTSLIPVSWKRLSRLSNCDMASVRSSYFWASSLVFENVFRWRMLIMLIITKSANTTDIRTACGELIHYYYLHCAHKGDCRESSFIGSGYVKYLEWNASR